MTKTKTTKTISASIKDAKAVKKPAAVKAAKTTPEPEKAEDRSYSFRTINVDNIVDSGNIREVKGIDDLIASIQAHGIINPITVTNDFGMSTNYRVLAGHRRLAAAVQLGLKKIPCHVVDKDQESIDEIQLSENVTRMDMTPYEECMAVKSLSNSKKTPAAIAKHFGRTLRWVLVRKKLADAGDKVLKKVKEGVIELAQAAKIADLPDNVFKRELEGCYRTDKYFIDSVLDRFHKDLSRAPFEHEACLQCSKCSACQADLFENEPKAFCLDPNCWARKAKKAAEAKVKKLQEEGRNARLGKFSSYGVDCMDEADKFEIGKYDSKGQEQAKEAGIQKRILVDAATLKTFEYFDKRDLPDYHEETEEEREAKEKAEAENEEFKEVKKDLFEENLANAISDKVEEDNEHGKLESLVFIMHFAQTDWLDNDEDLKKKIGIEDDGSFTVSPENFPEGYSVTDFTKTVIENLFDIICNWPLVELKGLYRIVMDETDNNPEKLAPTDEDVKKEIEKRKSEDNSSEDDTEGNDKPEDEEVDNE
ncbi:MAG: ParB/RepB/Spo0J family partition protein [Fibrobacter sp.]|nr:ParB/RepB/Spo0J family partition protein [Fibrobacter sp.]MBR6854895.1 ParB/RepB/Spo0J family partition protein [Fibrobacter sp.]